MSDEEKKFTIELKSAAIGAVLALLIGGTSFTVISAIFPGNPLIHALVKGFAGNVCETLYESEDAAEGEYELLDEDYQEEE